MAEFIMKKKVGEAGLADRFHIESRATSTEEIWRGAGNPVYPPARDELKKHGIDCGGKRAKLFTKEDYDKYDYVIGMDDVNIINMRRIAHGDEDGKFSKLLDYTEKTGDIADPWFTGDFSGVYEEIERGVTGLINFIKDKTPG